MTPGISSLTENTVTANGENASASARVSDQRRGLLARAQQEGQWLFVLLPYLFAWALPVSWCAKEWTNPAHVLFFQPFVPLLVVALLLSRRDLLTMVWRRLRGREEKSVWFRGNALILAVGCVTLTFAYLVQIKGVAIFGLLLIGWGVIYQVYGLRLLQTLWVPLSLSLLCIPWPDTIAEKINQLVNIKTLLLVSNLLRFTGHPAFSTADKINFTRAGYMVDFGSSAGGAGLISLNLLAVLFYGLIRRFDITRITLFLILTFIVSVLVNVCRVLMAGMLGGTAPAVAQQLAQGPTVVLASMVLAFLLTLLVESGLVHMIRKINPMVGKRLAPAMEGTERRSTPTRKGSSGAANFWKRSERSVSATFRKTPIARLNPFLLLGQGLKMSERAIERGFRRLFDNRKKPTRRR